MTNREKYIQLCLQEDLPLHAQAWWWEKSTAGKTWDAIIIEDDNRILAAMPYHMADKWCLHALLMPVHTQYHYVYLAPDAPVDTPVRLAQAMDALCRERHIGWCRLQGFYPPQLTEALRTCGFSTDLRTTYRIASVPPREELPDTYSQNKRRQLRKAQGLHLTEMSADAFYTFHRDCMAKQGKLIDYPAQWAQSVLPEAIRRQTGLLLGAQNEGGNVLAAMFLAWDSQYAYYLLPAYDPDYKDTGAMTWLTNEALCIAHQKGLGFDFEGSMIPSVALSYRQFGGEAASYCCIEKFYNPILRVAVRLHKHL